MPSGREKIANCVEGLNKNYPSDVALILQYCTEIPSLLLRPKKVVIFRINIRGLLLTHFNLLASFADIVQGGSGLRGILRF